MLIFHGGWTTPFSQVNETHLHASVARLWFEIENQYAFAKRKALSLRNVTPTLKRPDICDIVRSMWLSIDPKRVATKGYRQTGPEMRLHGPIHRDDVFKDLAGVWERIFPCDDPVEMSTKLRDEAIEYVREGHRTGKWTQWTDCHLLIQEHDGEDEPDVEGMEAFGVDAGDDDDDDDDDDGGGDNDCPGGHAVGPAALAEAPTIGGTHAASFSSSAGPTADGDGPSGGLTANDDAPSAHVLRVRQFAAAAYSGR